MSTREIKFRFWDIELKKFRYNLRLCGHRVFDTYESYGGIFSSGLIEKEVSDNVIIQQYTGVQDKNGDEIYEGDILQRGRGRALVDFNDKNFGYVPGWNLLLYQYLPYNQEKWECQSRPFPVFEFYYGCPPDNSWEIVGNIFEGITNKNE